MKVRFGELTFDGGRRLLLKRGETLHLSAKGFRLLELLLGRRPNAVSRDEIQDALWPDSLVTETTLANLVTEVRAALGETAHDARLIRTVWGFGYAFDGEATEEERTADGSPRHLLLWGDRELALRDGENLLGREPGLPVSVVHPSVSREHARITVSGDGIRIEDLGSKNGTFVAGSRLRGTRILRSGETVTVGRCTLLYLDRKAAAEDRTESASGSDDPTGPCRE